eukprot:scaffold74377_cov60-Phaeocystis_antarctica.AAC.7
MKRGSPRCSPRSLARSNGRGVQLYSTVTRAHRGGLHLPRLALQPPLRLEPLEQRLRRRLVEPAVLDGRAHQGLAHVLGHLLGGTRNVDMPLVVAEHLNGQRR